MSSSHPPAPSSTDVALVAIALGEFTIGMHKGRYKRADAQGRYPVVEEPLTPAVLRAHAAGEATIAAFYRRRDGLATHGTLDVDHADKRHPDHDAVRRAVNRLRSTLDDLGIPHLGELAHQGGQRGVGDARRGTGGRARGETARSAPPAVAAYALAAYREAAGHGGLRLASGNGVHDPLPQIGRKCFHTSIMPLQQSL